MRYKPNFRQELLIKHIQDLAPNTYRFISFICFTLVGRVISGSKKAHWTDNSKKKKEPRPKTNSLPYNWLCRYLGIQFIRLDIKLN